MRLTSVLNGAHFGNLAKVHGIVTYKLSPFEQRAFAGAISKGVPNMLRRIRSNIFRVTPRKNDFNPLFFSSSSTNVYTCCSIHYWLPDLRSDRA